METLLQKLLLVVSISAMTASKEREATPEFNETAFFQSPHNVHSDDIDHEQLVELLSEAGEAFRHVPHELIDYQGIQFSTYCEPKVPEVFIEAYKNQVERPEGDQDLFQQPTSSHDTAQMSSSALASDTGKECSLPYQCQHDMNMLNWFPYINFKGVYEFCYVPLNQWQKLTYATCRCPRCEMYKAKGTCRPSCYERRCILVFCYNLKQGYGYWTSVVRNLPQACRCST